MYICVHQIKPKFELNMKAFVKVVMILLTISFAMVNTSCSKKSQAFSSKSTARNNAPSYSAVDSKQQPVRKKYIVNGKRKTILGHDKPLR